MAWNQIVPGDDDGDAGGSHILLRASVDHTLLAPVDGLAAEVGGHVADEDLALGHLLVREIVELETLDCLIVAVVEELGIVGDVPLGGVSELRVARALVIGDLVGVAVLLGFTDGTLGPGARLEVVGLLFLSVFEEVVADGRKLKRRASLE